MANTASRTHRVSHDPPGEPDHEAYTSNVLKLFIEGLESQGNIHLLDVGPVCGENIMFLARRVRKVYICDMFTRLDRDLRKGPSSGDIWRHLDYPAQSFDAILLWDLCDRLDNQKLIGLIARCHTMVKKRGKVMITAGPEQSFKAFYSTVATFVIGDNFRIHFRPQPHIDLLPHVRQNRDIMAMCRPFSPLKSYSYRNGLREFLFARA